LQNREHDLDGRPARAGVVHTAATLPKRRPKGVERVSLAGPANTTRHRHLARAADTVDEHTIGREPKIAAFAGRDDDPEMRKIRLLGRELAAAEASL
jgi:hypothetical protein